MTDRMMNPPNPQPVQFTLIHVFNASKEQVFKAFSEPHALTQWWGPAQAQTSVIKLDFRPGGMFHYSMESTGSVTYGRFIFGNIIPFELLEFTNAFVDEQARLVKAPFDIPLPLEIFYRLTFTEHLGKTTLTLVGHPVNASPQEEAGFRSIGLSMQQGFGMTFAQLATYLN